MKKRRRRLTRAGLEQLAARLVVAESRARRASGLPRGKRVLEAERVVLDAERVTLEANRVALEAKPRGKLARALRYHAWPAPCGCFGGYCLPDFCPGRNNLRPVRNNLRPVRNNLHMSETGPICPK